MPFDPTAYGEEALADGAMPHSEQTSQRLDLAVERFAVQERQAAEAAKREMDLMTEARTRFAKAQLYESILEGRLFEEDDDLTLEVEDEFKAFAEERLRCLLGMESQKHSSSGDTFEEDEFNVLKLFAAKMLGRSASIPKPREAPKPTLVTRVAAPQARPEPVVLATPRRRGRPPGTGKHQRAAQMQAIQVQVAKSNQPVQDQPAKNEVKSVTLPNGRVITDTKQAKDDTLKPMPMPSGDQMVALAMMQGEQGLSSKSREMGASPAQILTSTNVPTEG